MKLGLYALLLCLTVAVGAVSAQDDGFMPVDSTKISAVKYEGGTLSLRFHDGASAIHPNVPEPLYKEFLNSRMKGGFYAGRIERAFPGTRTEPVVEVDPAAVVDPKAQPKMLFDEKGKPIKGAGKADPKKPAKKVAPVPLVVGGNMEPEKDAEKVNLNTPVTVPAEPAPAVVEPPATPEVPAEPPAEEVLTEPAPAEEIPSTEELLAASEEVIETEPAPVAESVPAVPEMQAEEVPAEQMEEPAAPAEAAPVSEEAPAEVVPEPAVTEELPAEPVAAEPVAPEVLAPEEITEEQVSAEPIVPEEVAPVAGDVSEASTPEVLTEPEQELEEVLDEVAPADAAAPQLRDPLRPAEAVAE